MLDDLIEILELSYEKNGEVKLTNLHLLNIMKMVRRKIEEDDVRNLPNDDYWYKD